MLLASYAPGPSFDAGMLGLWSCFYCTFQGLRVPPLRCLLDSPTRPRSRPGRSRASRLSPAAPWIWGHLCANSTSHGV